MARKINIGAAAALSLAASSAWAQDTSPSAAPSIQVVGVGIVKTAPDIASLSFDLRGEGATADKATQMLVDRQKAIVGALSALAGADPIAIHTSDMKIEATRSPDCKGDRFDDSKRLSTGACAILGYIASESVDLRTKDTKDAGTFVGLAGRLGAENASIESYDLEDSSAARAEATAKALADARAQATAIAQGSKSSLGALLSVRNPNIEPGFADIVVTAEAAPPPPEVSAPPIMVTTLPQPIETTVRLVVTYAIGPQR
jgi:uncharacterized protein YggE